MDLLEARTCKHFTVVNVLPAVGLRRQPVYTASGQLADNINRQNPMPDIAVKDALDFDLRLCNSTRTGLSPK